MSEGSGPGNLECRDFRSRGIILSPGQLYIKESMYFGRRSITKWRNDRLSCSEIFTCGSLTKLDGDALACVATRESLRYLAELGSTYERAFNIDPDS